MFDFPFYFPTSSVTMPDFGLGGGISGAGGGFPAPPTPEQTAGVLGSLGITPQSFLANPPASTPQPAPAESVPLPQPRPPEAGPGASAMAQAPGAGLGERLAGALRGVKAPEASNPKFLTPPAAPVAGAHGGIKGGELVALLNAIGRRQPGAMTPALPPLGQVLGGR